jgi:hypothetical protein
VPLMIGAKRGTSLHLPTLTHGNGSELDAGSTLIVRPALSSEAPAKCYLEDGSSRALALLQRILRYGEVGRTGWAYLGYEPDERSAFIQSHPEFKTSSQPAER